MLVLKLQTKLAYNQSEKIRLLELMMSADGDDMIDVVSIQMQM
jgi:hypothetical protein